MGIRSDGGRDRRGFPGEVGEKVIIELKCVDRFANEHLAQCIDYLKASRLSVELLINFREAQGGMETSSPRSLISWIIPATVLSSYFVDTTLD